MKYILDSQDLQFNDRPEMVWVRVRDVAKMIWDQNPKRHDLTGLMESISKRGLQELPKWDETLKGIKAGNGRVESLCLMEEEGYELPRGLATEKETGYWVMPVLIGVDAESRAEAIAYAVDSNNLALAGGDFNHIDMSKLYDMSMYLDLLNEVADENVFAITVNKEDLSALNHFEYLQQNGFDDFGDDAQEEDDDENDSDGGNEDDVDDKLPLIRARINPDLYAVYLDLTADFGESDEERLEGWLKQHQSGYYD